jgi:hypothetical protein
MRLLYFLSGNFSDCCAALLSSRRSALVAERHITRRIVRLSFTLLLVLIGAGSAFAMPLAEYKSRIHQAATVLDEFWEWEWEGSEKPAEYASRARAAFDKARRLVPVEETVEWEGGRVKVNNSWLAEEQKNYERTPSDDALSRVSQRLTALENRLDELDGQETSINATKEQEKARLESILRREEYVEKPPEKSLWERFKDWLNRIFPSRNPLTPGQSSLLSSIAMVLIFGLAASLLGYAIWKLVPLLQRWKGTQLKLEKPGARIVLGERLAPDQTGADLLMEAETLARKGEIRAAIRKGYIALLCELGDRKVLALAQHKTNHDYLRAVREKRPLLNEMQKLTASFENHWYGFLPADAHDWTTFRSGYQQTLKTASLLSDE